ncbi:uncharacterized protein LOC133185315 [Saccostrea echinata]|uniref:uncharacterized protein LOC133185315 n=1 Tax=Saccostrea echinata TaxID=191078 RepID=UPI002A7F9036|nr:uncharacterized protein LOC133185315 [Saccostrea echinata]
MSQSSISVFHSCIPTNVNIFRNEKLQAIVRIPDKIKSFSITPSNDSEAEGWILVLGSVSGQIYRTSFSEFKTQYEQAQVDFQTSLENQQIFTDLLDASSPVCEATERPAAVSPDTFVYTLTPSHIILSLRCPVLDVCQSLGFIFTVTEDDNCVKVHSYPSDVSHSLAESLTENILEVRGHMKSSSCKLFVLTCDLINHSDRRRSSSTLHISCELFKSICGEVVPLCNSPILLLTLGEGSVYYSPIKTNILSSQFSPFMLLYPTSKPVLRIQSGNLTFREMNRPDSDTRIDQKVINCLVMCSSNGDCAVLTHNEKFGAAFVQFSVPCSVVDFRITGRKLYISSGEDLYVADVVVSDSNDKCEVEVQKMLSLKFACAKEIHCVPDCSAVEEVASHVLCRTKLGRVSVIDVNVRIKQNTVNRATKQGQHIKELLTAIENCHLQTQTLVTKEERQQEFISQLNIASHLIRYKGLLKCECAVLQQVRGSEFFLSCKVTNESGLKLSCDWSLLVDVHQSNPNKTTSANERLDRGVRHSDSVLIQVNLPSQNTNNHYHVTLTLCLHFPNDLESLPEEKSSLLLPILVHQEILDILNFLYDEKCLYQKTCQTRLTLHASIMKMALSRPSANTMQTKCTARMEEDQLSEVHLLVPAALLKNPEISAYGQDVEGVLKFLTQNCQHQVDVLNQEARLVDPSGELVRLSVEILDTGVDGPSLKITISTRPIALAAAVREAASRRIQNAGKNENSKECLLKGTLPSLDIPSVSSSSMTKKDLIEMYRQLRCVSSN